MLKKVVVYNSNNAAGIYGFRFFIRGKPWDVVIDDQLYFSSGNIVFSKPNTDSSKILWGPMLEKAWAKAIGNYAAYTGNGDT